MNVLSLFDGISSGQIALNRAGVKYDKYFASEIDKHAIKVTQSNYPDTIQLGSVTEVFAKDLPKIELLIGGSPCQSFSFAGKRNGMTTLDNLEITSLLQYLELKNEGFNFKGQSYLFWEYVRILKEIKPKYFFLENVKMAKKWEDIITETLGVSPIHIDSQVISSQMRKRLYWTNIPIASEIPTKNLYAQDIVSGRILTKNEITQYKDQLLDMDFGGFESDNSKRRILLNIKGGDQKINCLTASNTYNPAGCGCSNFVYLEDGNLRWRKINREECEKAQTLPVGYTREISDNLAKKAIGNGWTVDVIVHFFKSLSGLPLM